MMGWKKVSLGLGIVFSLFLFIDIAHAGVNWTKWSYFLNTGGLNDNLSSTEIADNEASDLQNVVFDTGGAVKKRYGYSAVSAEPVGAVATGDVVSITGLAFYQKNNGNRCVVALANNDGTLVARKKDYTSSTGGLENGNWEDIDDLVGTFPSSYSANYISDFTVAEDNLIFTIGTTSLALARKPYKYTGTGGVAYLTTDTDCPTATMVEYHKNHLFLAGNYTDPSRVWFSELDDITTYTATDFFDVQTADGTQVRGLKSAFDSLYIFKDKSIWRLSGNERDSFQLSLMVSGVGTLSNNSIQVIGGFIYFTTAQGDIAVYDGAYTVGFPSQKIRNTIGGLNFQRAQYAQGLAFSTYKYADCDYYCSVSSALVSEHDTVLLYDTAYKAWTKFKGINANVWCVADGSAGQNAILFGDNDGYVHQYPSTHYYDCDVASEAVAGFVEVTNAITAFYQTKWFKYDSLCLGDKYWRLLKTYTLSEDTTTYLEAECKADQEASGKILTLSLTPLQSLWDTAIWDSSLWGGVTIMISRNEVEKGKEMFQLKYSNDDVNRGFTVLGWSIFIEPTDRI